ncbi:MAG: hypothetical protein AAF467_09280 [Actinomycetota bacterium]
MEGPEQRRLVQGRNLLGERLLGVPGVTAVGIGLQEFDGRPTGRVVPVAIVEEKRPLDRVDPIHAIPKSIRGIPVDVHVGGRPQKLSLLPGASKGGTFEIDRTMKRPLRGGVAMSNSRTTPEHRARSYGTLGVIMIDTFENFYALTNAHVVADDDWPASQDPANHKPAYQPDAVGGRPNIGVVVGLEHSGHTDVGLIRLASGVSFVPAIQDLGPPGPHRQLTASDLEAAAPQGGIAVRKRGARTGLTGGRIVLIQTFAIPETPAPAGAQWWTASALDSNNGDDILLEGGHVIRGAPDMHGRPGDFMLAGDSGSVVLDDDHRVVGLGWGRSKDGGRRSTTGPPPRAADAWATPIETVISSMSSVAAGLEVVVPLAGEDQTEPDKMTPRTVP